MLKDRNKREAIAEFQPETVLDLLQKLPKRLLMHIVETYGLEAAGTDKFDYAFVITENRKAVFRSLKFSFSYVQPNNVSKERNVDPDDGNRCD